MDKNTNYRILEEDFKATFIKELIPGILHNFANPLNGIMGRSKLLQRRIDDVVRKIDETYPDTAAAMSVELQKIKSDIHAINQESDFYYTMFRDVSNKFYTLASKREDTINLSHLLDMEMRFSSFYLDFKHEIKKNSRFKEDIYDFKGNTSDCSMAFWRLIRFAMSRALTSEKKEFYISTHSDREFISVLIKDSGAVIPEDEIMKLMKALESRSADYISNIIENSVFSAFMLLNNYQAKIKIYREDDLNTISLDFPCRQR